MPIVNVTCNGADDGRVCMTITAPSFPVNIEITHETSGVIPNIASPVLTPPSAVVTPSGSGADLDTPGRYCWDALEPGKYTVVIVDTSPTPCIINTEFEITEPDSLSIDYEIVSGNCNDGSVTIQASADGGSKFPSGGYRFTLDGGDLSGPINKNNGLFKNIPSSTTPYTLTVTDANGCTDTTNIEIDSTNEITIEYGFKNVSCYGACDGEISVVGTGGQPPYRFILVSDPPGTFVKTNDCDPEGNSCVTSYIFKDLCAGDYTLKVVDANGCNFELPSSITIDQPTEIVYAGPVVANVTCDDCCTRYSNTCLNICSPSRS